MRKIILPSAFLGLLLVTSLVGCKEDDEVTNDDSTTTSITSVVETSFINGVTVSVSNSQIVIRSNGLPDHKTPYWGTDNELYEEFPTGHHANVNTSMTSHNYAMTIPTNPTVASTHEETTLGPIGLALNGVPIYNDREGGNIPLDALTITTFDASGAHPGPGEDYHYHTTGKYVSTDDNNLIGFLRDGFPIYGRQDADGSYPSDLDIYGGHTSTTTQFPDGIYHYHSSNVNYLNTGYYVLKEGSYYGTKGTFVQ